MTPLTIIIGLAEIVLFPCAAKNYNNWLGIALFILGALGIFFYMYVYHYWMKKDPNRIQSERFNLEQRYLDVVPNDDFKLIRLDESKTIEIDQVSEKPK